MRCLYFDASDPREAAAHDLVVRKIDDWWHEFASKTQDLVDLFKRRSEWDLPDWMHRHLNAICPDLMWEYGPAVGGNGHRLVITPESKTYRRPMVQTLLERSISRSRTLTLRRPSMPVAAQTNTAIPIEPAMITHTSGELLYLRTMSPKSDPWSAWAASSLSWSQPLVCLKSVSVLVPGPAASVFRPAISMWSDKRDN